MIWLGLKEGGRCRAGLNICWQGGFACVLVWRGFTHRYRARLRIRSPRIGRMLVLSWQRLRIGEEVIQNAVPVGDDYDRIMVGWLLRIGAEGVTVTFPKGHWERVRMRPEHVDGRTPVEADIDSLCGEIKRWLLVKAGAVQ